MFYSLRKFLKPNKIVKYLILSDLVFWTGWGLATPVFAVFIVEKIQGGNVLVVGIASAIFWLVKSLIMIPIGIFLDKKPSEKDDYLVLLAGLFIASFVPFGYIFATLPWHIYILQAAYGFSLALAFPGWLAIFSRHLDKGKESTQWSMESTAIGLGMGVAGGLGGWLVMHFGFNVVFASAGVIGLIGAIIALALRKEIKD